MLLQMGGLNAVEYMGCTKIGCRQAVTDCLICTHDIYSRYCCATLVVQQQQQQQQYIFIMQHEKGAAGIYTIPFNGMRQAFRFSPPYRGMVGSLKVPEKRLSRWGS